MKMMKRIAAITAAGMLACAPAMADLALSQLTWDQLIAVQKAVTLERMKRPECKEITVPGGVYQVGVDIPAGKWTLAPSKGKTMWVYLGTELNKSHTDFTSRGYVDGHYFGSTYGIDSWTWDLMDGYYLILKGPVVFTRYAGPSFTFK